MPSDEDWEIWCDHPITRMVAAAYARMAEENRLAWISVSWDGGDSSPETLLELRTRADVNRQFLDCVKEDFFETANRK